MISIVLPVYKVKEEYVRRCMECLYAQTYQNFELIMVDDCTPDNGGQLCEEIASKDPRITVIHHEVNKGLAGARETGKNLAKGNYLFFLDPDDTIEIDCLEKLHSAIQSTQADIVLCKYRRNVDFPASNNTEKLLCISNYNKLREDILLQNDTKYNIGSNWGKLYRLDFIREHSITFEESARKSQDRVFMFDFYGAKPVIYMMDYVGYVYTVDNEDSICQKYNPNFLTLIKSTSTALAKRVEKEKAHNFSSSLNGWYMMLIFDYLRLVACNNQNTKTEAEKVKDFKVVLSKAPYKEAIWGAPVLRIRKKCALMIILIRLKQYAFCFKIMKEFIH